MIEIKQAKPIYVYIISHLPLTTSIIFAIIETNAYDTLISAILLPEYNVIFDFNCSCHVGIEINKMLLVQRYK